MFQNYGPVWVHLPQTFHSLENGWMGLSISHEQR